MHTLENYADTTFCCILQRLLLFLFNGLNFLAQPNFNHLQLRLLTNRLASESHSLPTVGCVNVTVRCSGAAVAAVVDVVDVELVV
jgi:hypothetical protein